MKAAHSKTLPILIASLLAAPSVSYAFSNSDLSRALREFERDPKKFMNTIPEKEVNNRKAKIQSVFTKDAIRKKKYVEEKNKTRPIQGKSGIQSNDRAENLVYNSNKMLKSLEEIERKRLQKAELSVQPWSDHYWALYQGQTAFRYADKDFPNSSDWKRNFDYIMKNIHGDIDSLAPAEKYDLLVGDDSKSLTKSALGEGEQYYRSSRKVEEWMGICHGWAPAAYMLDRPSSSVSVLAADGRTKITFYPSDIKALASLLWAKHSSEVNFVGGRCDTKEPKQDENGRIYDQNCFDTNPGAWHLALVNQIGISDKSLVMDATFDYEVWNQPILSYEYTYFNPETKAPSNSLRSAKVSANEFRSDKFRKYRDNNTRSIVGISMTVKYMAENNPTIQGSDAKSNDNITTVRYIYDLELDSNDNIIGGEWYQNAHPDFLWTPVKDARAVSPGDTYLARTRADRKKWSKEESMPREWQEIAKRNSSNGSPLAVIVENLIQFSNEKDSSHRPIRKR
ncbi:MAG: hypothetical protein M9962_03550 [Oligoflexia bacterium]|nr:hypothetical protein [Oligoflexia bacterium]